jgi:tetratricopeptide (TPR) repeat protein
VTSPRRFSIFRRLWPDSLGAVHYVFAVVFLVRLVALIRLTSSPLLLPTGSDMQFYDEWAKQILHGHWTDHQAFYGLPLYPFLLAALYATFGYGPFVPGLFQAGFEAGTAVLIYKITVRTMTSRSGPVPKAPNLVGAGAALAWCFFVPAQAYSAILMPTAGAVFVFWLLVWQILAKPDRLSWRRCLGCGVLIGFAAMGVATALFLIPLFLLAIVLRGEAKARTASRLGAIGLLLGGVLVGTSPCWIHNCFIARDPVFLSAHGGINFWLGNNPGATGYPRFPGLHAGQGQMLRDSIDQAEAAAGRRLQRAEVSKYWSGKARDYIAVQPTSFLKLLARKTGNFWNAFEYDDLGVVAVIREHGLIFPGLRFALAAVLGLSGALFSWRRFPDSRWIVAAIVLQFLAILPIFVTERYRLAVVPGLLVLAALGLERLWDRLAFWNYGGATLQLGVVALSAWFVTLPRDDPSLWALDAYNSGRFALETNSLPLAEHYLRRAHTLVPENAETNLALGNLRLAQGDSPAARMSYEAVLKIDPKHKGALNNLGVLALNENHPVEAASYFQRALALEPRNAKTHYLLAKAFDLAGNRADARTEAARAVELDPAQPEFKALQDQLAGNGQ